MPLLDCPLSYLSATLMASLFSSTITPQELHNTVTLPQKMFKFLPTYVSDTLMASLFSLSVMFEFLPTYLSDALIASLFSRIVTLKAS
jgi:hypothetical protein